LKRALRYHTIAGELRRRIASGDLPPGRLLPSESQLGAAYAASRSTVRKALLRLKDEGVIDSRQGFGWYAVAAPLRQSLRDLTTMERQIVASGRSPSREILGLSRVRTPDRLADVLPTNTALEITRVDRVDDQPFAVATVWLRADLARGVTRRSLARRPLSDQLDVTLGGATQAMSAVAASDRDAQLLHVPKGAPLLRCERTTSDSAGIPVLRSEALYNPLLTEFVTELPPALDDGVSLRQPGTVSRSTGPETER
jgi:GntR family transcriptional regulator